MVKNVKIDIRNNIQENFQGASLEEIKTSVESSIEEAKEITLPGLGVFFELLWKNSDESDHEFILNTIKKALK